MRLAVVGHIEWIRFARVRRIPSPGGIEHATESWEGAGGGGAVAAVQLARLAGTCLFLSASGADQVAGDVRTDLAWKGVEKQHQAIDPANRYGGLPHEKPDVYKERSPLYNIDKLQIPLYVGVTKNDQDVNIEEDMQLVDALRARKPLLAETTVYDNPLGGHTFDRRVDPKTWQPENTREQRDSWNRVWTFLDWNLDPFHDAATAIQPSATLQSRAPQR